MVCKISTYPILSNHLYALTKASTHGETSYSSFPGKYAQFHGNTDRSMCGIVTKCLPSADLAKIVHWIPNKRQTAQRGDSLFYDVKIQYNNEV